MGQAPSQPEQSATKIRANFFHVCNIIPDTPEHTHHLWDVEQFRQTQTDAQKKKGVELLFCHRV